MSGEWPPNRAKLESTGWRYGDLPHFNWHMSKAGVGCAVWVGDRFKCWTRYTAQELAKREQERGIEVSPPDHEYVPPDDDSIDPLDATPATVWLEDQYNQQRRRVPISG